jgi:integrase
MSAEPCLFEPDQFASGWSWPLTPSNYQRDLTLSREELKALARWTEYPLMGGSGRQKTVLALHRLRQPIADVLAVTGAQKVAWRGTMRLLLEEMHHRQMPFWAWTVDEWVASTYVSNPRAAKWSRVATDCRQHFLAVGYFLCGFRQFHEIGKLNRKSFIRKVFGPSYLNDAVEPIMSTLTQWGYQPKRLRPQVPEALAAILLFNRSPHLTDITLATLESLYFNNWVPAYIDDDLYLISRVLAEQGIIQQPLPLEKHIAKHEDAAGQTGDITQEWLDWCQRWEATTTLTPISRAGAYHDLLKAGRWLAQKYPEITSPEQWTRDVAIEYVAAVDRMLVGEYVSGRGLHPNQIGKPLTPNTKRGCLSTMRTFFRDCQSWGWMTTRFDPLRCFATPRSIRARIGPNPRVIADDIWAKLLWAGLNLTEEDLPLCVARDGAGKLRRRAWWYPLEMVKALATTWLFGGLRADEICRLRVGCIRWQWPDGLLPDFNTNPATDAICLLDIPTNKTNTAFTKPVDRNLGEAVEMWERVRPDQPPALDPKTGEVVDYLFSYRAYKLRTSYLNRTLIPMLCRKAGVPREDARGPITSHRARSTIASQLFNSKEPMSLFELQAWLGHRSPDTTQYYTKVTPTRLAKAYQDAGYFERNLRTIEVLIDQEAIRSGAAALGEPWRFYDLGHGYCTYDFFDQCPHRMACAKCAFYCPKDSSQAQLLEAKSNLQRMLQEIPLTNEERAAVDDGLTAIEKLSQQLMDVPTPAGPTPRQLAEEKGLVIPLLPSVRERGNGKV